MRLIHNLVEATPIDSTADMVKALKAVERLLNKLCLSTLTVNKWVAATNYGPDFFAEYQWHEEQLKAQLRQGSHDWDSLLDQAERHPYLNGQIGVTLYLGGYIPVCYPFNTVTRVPDHLPYDNILKRALPLFTAIGDASTTVVKDFLMVKTMLATDHDYMPQLSAGRRNLYNRPGHRDYSWKRLFRIDSSSYAKAIDALGKILTNPLYNPQQVETSLQRIAKAAGSLPQWCEILLGPYGTNLMQISTQGYIAFDNGNAIIYHKSRRNHKHSELLTRHLYEELRARGMKVEYYSVRSGEDDCVLCVKNHHVTQWNGTWTLSTPKGRNSTSYTDRQLLIAAIEAL